MSQIFVSNSHILRFIFLFFQTISDGGTSYTNVVVVTHGGFFPFISGFNSVIFYDVPANNEVHVMISSKLTGLVTITINLIEHMQLS
jgi:hypothetical protein